MVPAQAATADIVTTGASEADRALAVLLLAFAADPIARWMFPDPGAYVTHSPVVMRAFGGRAFAAGTAHHIPGFLGAALWLAPGVEPDHEALMAEFERNVPGDRLGDLFALFERMGACHPPEPHWYLPLIGVDPTHQGNGHGSSLLRHALQMLDREHLTAYLESSNPLNLPLYRRHGFELIDTLEAGSTPPVFPMVRPAR